MDESVVSDVVESFLQEPQLVYCKPTRISFRIASYWMATTETNLFIG